MYKLPDPAHLPKHQYTVVTELDAPIDECFVAGSSVEAMMAWAPNAVSVVYDHSAAAQPFGAGSWRKVTVKSGVSLVEVIFISEAPKLCGYCIPAFGMGVDAIIKNYQGRMNFEALDANRTRLTWNGYFDCPGWRALFEPLFRPILRNLIATMSKKMQQYHRDRKRG